MKWIRRHKIISGLLAVVALIIIIVAASSGGKTPSTVSVTDTTQAAAPAASAAANSAPGTAPSDTGQNDCYFATLNSTDTTDIADNNFDGAETVDVSSAYAFETNGPCTWVLVS